MFADGVRGEIGRGGAYSVVHPDGATEPAVGFSLYIDGLVDAGLGITPRRRIALPAGTPPAVAARLRAEGWTTVAALDTRDADRRDCSHVWDGTAAVAIERTVIWLTSSSSARSGATRARARSSTGCRARAEVVVRFQGGHNAGHTLVVGNEVYKLSLLPSGIVRGALSVIGNGVVFDPWHFKAEVEKLRGQGVEITPGQPAGQPNSAR